MGCAGWVFVVAAAELDAGSGNDGSGGHESDATFCCIDVVCQRSPVHPCSLVRALLVLVPAPALL